MTMNPVTVTPLDWRYLENNPYVVPGGTYATLDAILAATPASGTSIMVSTAQTVASRTVPAGVNITCTPGGIITVPNGVTLTFAATATLTAGDYQIFNCTGTGKVSGLTYGKLRWWGATGDGVTEDTTAINAASTCIFAGTGGVLEGTPNDIYLVEPITVDPICIYGSIFDGRRSVLKQKTTGNVLNIGTDGGRGKLLVANWRISGAAAGNDGKGIYIWGQDDHGIGPVTIINTEIDYFEYGLYFSQMSYSLIDTCYIHHCDTLIYGRSATGAIYNNFNEFRNLRLSTSTVNHIYVEYAGTLKFSHVDLEGCLARVATLVNCNSIGFDNLHIEGNGTDDAATEAFYFDGCTGVAFRDSHLALGGGAALTAHIRLANSSRNISIDGGKLACATAIPLFVDDGTGKASALSIANCYVEPNANRHFGRVSYIARNNTAGAPANGALLIVPLESTVRRDDRACKNYADAVNVNAPSNEANCTAAVDSAAYGTTDAIKFTPDGVGEPSYKCGNGSTAVPAGTYYGIYSVMVKLVPDVGTDDQTMYINTPLGNPSAVIPGDGKWRQVNVLSTAVVNPGTFYTYYKGTASTPAGNVWFACPQYRVFATYAEACQWVGAVGY